jgi:acetyl/propionyl-CoA carboxylase alpha subunit
MEMNTRLQVEHPVTEEITGLDLVELQIRVAQGEELPKQTSITLKGHAVEARIYAEDPANDFLPSVGPLDILELPQEARIDTGVEQGGKVSLYYDPMISKIIVHEKSRKKALKALRKACENTHVYPVKTNTRFLVSCLAHEAFIAGDVSTNFIAAYESVLLPDNQLDVDREAIAGAIAPEKIGSVFGSIDGWRMNLPTRDVFTRTHAGEDLVLPLGMKSKAKHMARPEGDVVFVKGMAYLVQNGDGVAGDLDKGDNIAAPMPGKIIATNVKAGDPVSAGDPLIVMEAMKMEMTLEAPRDGIVASVTVKANDLVNDGDVLLDLESE